MASAIVMSSPVHQISLPLGCTAVVEEPSPQREENTATTSFMDPHQPRTLSPSTSLERLPPPTLGAGDHDNEMIEESRPLMHSTSHCKPPQQLQQPPLASSSIHGDSSGYAMSSQTPPVKIMTSSSPGPDPGPGQCSATESETVEVSEHDKWQFPITDRSAPQNYSGYDSDLSEPSPYAIVRNNVIIADVEPRSHEDCGVDRFHRRGGSRDPGYEQIELRRLPSLPNSRQHSRLGGAPYIGPPPWPVMGPPIIEQPRSIKAALRDTRGLSQAVQKLLRKANDFLRNQQLKDAISCLESSLLHTNDHPLVQSLIWMLLGNAHVNLGDFSKASICHLHYLAFCRERNDFPGMTRAECSLGIAYMKLGLYKLAGRCFLQYLENCQLLQDGKGISVAYNNLGLLSKILATDSYVAGMKEENAQKAEEMLRLNLKRAVSYFEKHLGFEEQFGNVNKQANAFGNLGTCNELLKHYTQAIFCHNKRLEISRSIGDRSTESCALCNLGNCFRAIGKLEEALQYYILNLELTRSLEHKSGEVVTLLNLGTTYELLNKLDQAIEWYTLYLSLTMQREDVQGQARGLCILASLYQETKQLVKAHEYYKKLVGIFHQLGENDAEASAQLFMEMTRREIEKEKQISKMSKRKRKRLSKKANTISRSSGLTLTNPSPNTVAEQERSQPQNIATARPPHPQRARPPLAVDGIITLTPAQRTEFEKMKREAHMRSTDSLAAACIFENPAYIHLQEEYHNQGGACGYEVPVLPNPNPAQNEYYQQWMQRRRDMEEHRNHEVVPSSSDFIRSTSPIFSDSGWSHTRTPGLSPEQSQLDWTYSDLYTLHQGGPPLHATLASSLQRAGVTAPLFLGSSGVHSPPVLRNDGGHSDHHNAIRQRRHHHYDDIESDNDSVSVSDEQEEDSEGDTMPPQQRPAATIRGKNGDQEGEGRKQTATLQPPKVMRSVSNCSSMLGSQRHLQELEKIGRDFTHHKGGDQESDLDDEGVDKEWEQWIKMQEDDALTRVVSMKETDVNKYRNRYRRRAHRQAFRPAVSAPQLGGEPPISEEDLSESDDDDLSQYSSNS